ncbi:MAG: hypothetical protein ACE5GF_06290, partial [Thermodesulfobacteriota bacterium]
MKRGKGQTIILMLFLLLFSVIIPPGSFGQEAVVVMTLKGKRYSAVVAMNRGQLAEVSKQPGISLMKVPKLTSSTQMAIPLPSSLGGGYLVAEPKAIAAALNVTGLTTRATAEGVMGATAAEGDITKGAAVSAEMVSAGVKKGTVVVEVVIAAGVVAAIIAALGGDG